MPKHTTTELRELANQPATLADIARVEDAIGDESVARSIADQETRAMLTASEARDIVDHQQLKEGLKGVRSEFGWIRTEVSELKVQTVEQTVMLRVIKEQTIKDETRAEREQTFKHTGELAKADRRNKIVLQILALLGVFMSAGGIALLASRC